MKRNLLVKTVAAVFFAVGVLLLPLNAEEQVSAQAEKVQEKCPIMGGAISKKVFTDDNGKRVYFCCPGCIETFKANPQKSLEQFRKAGISLESSPVMPVTNSGSLVTTSGRKDAGKVFQSQTLQSVGGLVSDRSGRSKQVPDSGSNKLLEPTKSNAQSGQGGCGGCCGD